MLIVANIVVTMLLWGMLIFTIVKYWRNSNRAKALEEQIAALKEEHRNREQRADKQRDFEVSRAFELRDIFRNEAIQLKKDIEILKKAHDA